MNKTLIFKSVLLSLFLMKAMYAFPQPPEKLIKITVSPDHADWLYKTGENAAVSICVWKDQVPMKDVPIYYEISEDLMKPHKTGNIVLKDGTFKLPLGTLKKAGFLRCKVTVNYQKHKYEDAATIGFSPEELRPTTQRPKDFKDFWDKELKKVAEQPLDPRITLIPEKCTSTVNVYHVGFRNNWAGSRMYGILCVPKDTSKKYPAILKVPGAGMRAYHGEIALASQGVITLEIGIHGIPVNLPNEAYTIGGGPLLNYHDKGLDYKENYYYKRVYIGCKRAVDFIFSLPEFDGTKPQYCHPKAIETIRYYNVANFVTDIKVPVFMSFGYNDTTCPPTTSYSVMNKMTCPITPFIVPDSYHFMYPEQREAAVSWALNLLHE